VGISRAQQEKNSAAFRAMIRIARERGVDVIAGIWDHITAEAFREVASRRIGLAGKRHRGWVTVSDTGESGALHHGALRQF